MSRPEGKAQPKTTSRKHGSKATDDILIAGPLFDGFSDCDLDELAALLDTPAAVGTNAAVVAATNAAVGLTSATKGTSPKLKPSVSLNVTPQPPSTPPPPPPPPPSPPRKSRSRKRQRTRRHAAGGSAASSRAVGPYRPAPLLPAAAARRRASARRLPLQAAFFDATRQLQSETASAAALLGYQTDEDKARFAISLITNDIDPATARAASAAIVRDIGQLIARCSALVTAVVQTDAGLESDLQTASLAIGTAIGALSRQPNTEFFVNTLQEQLTRISCRRRRKRRSKKTSAVRAALRDVTGDLRRALAGLRIGGAV